MYFYLNSYENRTWHQTKINTYKELEWIDHQTSQIQVEMLIYNPNYQLMSSLAATIQMKKGGRFECSYRIESMPAWPYGANRVALIVMDALMLVVLLPLIMLQVLVNLTPDEPAVLAKGSAHLQIRRRPGRQVSFISSLPGARNQLQLPGLCSV